MSTKTETPDLKLLDPGAPKAVGVAARWPGRLTKGGFVPVSSYFMANYHRLRPHEGAQGLSSAEAMVIIHLMSFKWTEDAPFPTLRTIATRMGVSVRQVRNYVKSLEDLGYIRRVRTSEYGPNRFFFEGLWSALENLMDEDIARQDEEEEEEDDDSKGGA